MDDTDLESIRKQCIDSLYLVTDNVLKYMDSETDGELNLLRKCVKQYCEMEALQQFQTQALESAAGDTDASNLDSLDAKYNAVLNHLETQSRLNIDNHPFMKKFEQRIRRGQVTFHNLNISDVVITETQEMFLDPITKKPIQDPVRNTMCGHMYEREAIVAHISSRRARCPVVGCGNQEPVKASHLVEDDEMRLRMSAPRSNTDRSIMDLDETASQ